MSARIWVGYDAINLEWSIVISRGEAELLNYMYDVFQSVMILFIVGQNFLLVDLRDFFSVLIFFRVGWTIKKALKMTS